MHKTILSDEEFQLLPVLENYSNNFYLVGGTAIALYLGHRRSIDFDLASSTYINANTIRNKLPKTSKIENVMVDNKEEYSIVYSGIRITFFYYPFHIKTYKNIEIPISMPDLLSLAAMKAYAIGRRNKWKDYVDLYFIAEKYGSIKPIIDNAKLIFKNEFNEKIFRSQLAYFKDIDYSEELIFMKGFKIDKNIIKNKLIEYSLIY
ncbi:nucleotidyl transferase AbiEii/AbiGii toxin family protein [Patescibacteria group bacterium]|nr:nucleotidyl transferase AbiEii/AbiGii toxin family protein [Patescibacteria group bacterium]